MQNIEKFAKYMAKYGTDGIIIHKMPTTKYWVVTQKTMEDEWITILCDPFGSSLRELPRMTNTQHLDLWKKLTHLKLENIIKIIEKQQYE